MAVRLETAVDPARSLLPAARCGPTAAGPAARREPAQTASCGLGRRVVRTAFQSSPSNSVENCAGDNAIIPSDGCGH